MVKLKDITSIFDLFKILKNTVKGREWAENFNRAVLFELQKQNQFNKLAADPNITSSVQFIFKFKRKNFDKIAQTLLTHIYNDIKDKKIIKYKLTDDISPLIKNVAKYIKTNANIIQMAYNLWREKHADDKNENKSSQQENSIYNADSMNDSLFQKATFNYTNSGQIFIFVNDKFILDESATATYPTDEICNQLLDSYGEGNVRNFAFGMQYPSGSCFVVKEQNMGVSTYQTLKQQANATKIYKVLAKKRNKLTTQRMAKRIV